MRRLGIRHLTRYRYDAPVRFLPHRLCIRPREGHDIRIASSTLRIEPAANVAWHRDVYGNSVAVLEFTEQADTLLVESDVIVEHYDDDPAPAEIEPYGATYPFQYDAQERADLSVFQLPLFAKEGDVLRGWVDGFWGPNRILSTWDLVVTINQAVSSRFGYVRREEPGVQRPSETLQIGGGSCRDLATLFIETCRHLGLAARFVSGYLHAPGLPAAEGATHAWGEVYLPGAGWRGFDSTIGDLVGGDHIAVAVSRHPEMVPPVAGAFSADIPVTSSMDVEVDVAPV